MPECGNVRCHEGVLYDSTATAIGVCKVCEKVETMMENNQDFVIYHRNGRPVGYEYVGNGNALEIIKDIKN